MSDCVLMRFLAWELDQVCMLDACADVECGVWMGCVGVSGAALASATGAKCGVPRFAISCSCSVGG